MAKVAVQLVAPQLSWATRFSAEEARLAEALDGKMRRVEHIGSTAVLGLMAKDVVDILVAVDHFDLDSEYVSALEPLGYEFRPDPEDPEHRLFHLNDSTLRRLVNLHICVAGTEWERDRIAFRDALRDDAALRIKYQALKLSLAEQYDNAQEYADAKGPFITSALSGGEASPNLDNSLETAE